MPANKNINLYHVTKLPSRLVRVRVDPNPNPNPNPKTAFFKKKIDPDPGPRFTDTRFRGRSFIPA